MKKIAALYICTGKYARLWPGFLESAEKYLLKSCEVHYFVFTDAEHLEGETENPRIHRIEQEPMPWPYTTLLRFEIFLKIEEQLKAFDYIYFFNANCAFMQPITEEMLLPRPESTSIWCSFCTQRSIGAITMSTLTTVTLSARLISRWAWGGTMSAGVSTAANVKPI